MNKLHSQQQQFAGGGKKPGHVYTVEKLLHVFRDMSRHTTDDPDSNSQFHFGTPDYDKICTKPLSEVGNLFSQRPLLPTTLLQSYFQGPKERTAPHNKRGNGSNNVQQMDQDVPVVSTAVQIERLQKRFATVGKIPGPTTIPPAPVASNINEPTSKQQPQPQRVANKVNGSILNDLQPLPNNINNNNNKKNEQAMAANINNLHIAPAAVVAPAPRKGWAMDALKKQTTTTAEPEPKKENNKTTTKQTSHTLSTGGVDLFSNPDVPEEDLFVGLPLPLPTTTTVNKPVAAAPRGWGKPAGTTSTAPPLVLNNETIKPVAAATTTTTTEDKPKTKTKEQTKTKAAKDNANKPSNVATKATTATPTITIAPAATTTTTTTTKDNDKKKVTEKKKTTTPLVVNINTQTPNTGPSTPKQAVPAPRGWKNITPVPPPSPVLLSSFVFNTIPDESEVEEQNGEQDDDITPLPIAIAAATAGSATPKTGAINDKLGGSTTPKTGAITPRSAAAKNVAFANPLTPRGGAATPYCTPAFGPSNTPGFAPLNLVPNAGGVGELQSIGSAATTTTGAGAGTGASPFDPDISYLSRLFSSKTPMKSPAKIRVGGEDGDESSGMTVSLLQQHFPIFGYEDDEDEVFNTPPGTPRRGPNDNNTHNMAEIGMGNGNNKDFDFYTTPAVLLTARRNWAARHYNLNNNPNQTDAVDIWELDEEYYGDEYDEEFGAAGEAIFNTYLNNNKQYYYGNNNNNDLENNTTNINGPSSYAIKNEEYNAPMRHPHADEKTRHVDIPNNNAKQQTNTVNNNNNNKNNKKNKNKKGNQNNNKNNKQQQQQPKRWADIKKSEPLLTFAEIQRADVSQHVVKLNNEPLNGLVPNTLENYDLFYEDEMY